MHNVITSRHIRTSSELFLMVPIKPGFAPISDVVLSYASRVSTVLSALFELRQHKVERGHGEQVGPIERLETIYRVQWSVLRNFDELRNAVPQVRSSLWTQIKGPQLILTSHFDSTWETYFRDLVEIGGPLLDLIFSHCVGYEDHSCKKGYEAFSEWIRWYQRPIDFLFAAAPEITVTDLRYFRALMARLSNGPASLADVRVPTEEDEAKSITEAIAKGPVPTPGERFWSITNAVNALYDIRSRLFSNEVELEGRTGTELYEDAVYSVLEKEPDAALLRATLESLQKKALAAHDAPAPAPSGTPAQNEPAPSQPRPEEAETAEPAPAPARENAISWIQGVLQKPRKSAAAETSDRPQMQASAASTESHASASQAPVLDTNNVQTNLLERLAEPEYGALLLLHCEPADSLKVRDSLRKLCEKMAASSGLWGAGKADIGTPEPDQVFLNFALTYAGLQRAQLGEDVMSHFPREFCEGMEERAGLLGDVGTHNHPRFWHRPLCVGGERIHLGTVDAVLVLHAETKKHIDNFIRANETDLFSPGIRVLHRLDLSRKQDDSFGFRDQISQPRPTQNLPVESDEYTNDTALGEFLLGYGDRSRRIARCADPEKNPGSCQLFKDSTFMVVRKMAQNLDAFDSHVKTACSALNQPRAPGQLPSATPAVTAEDIHVAIVGRRRDGGLRNSPQVTASAPAPNNFDFRNDPHGAVCPLASHIRRANPRVPGTPRILRRGFSYGPDLQEKNEEGVLFIAYNASIAAQYEIIQRYINGANATGLSSFQSDPLCGARSHPHAPHWLSTFRHQNEQVGSAEDEQVGALAHGHTERPFVMLRWGLYLFVPSRRAVKWLIGELKKEPEVESIADAVARGRHRLGDLDAMPLDLAKLEWKRVLEEVPEAGSAQARESDDIWAAVRNCGGVKKIDTELVVVGGEAAAKVVLGDDGGAFSVREYRERMATTIGDHYLAHDVRPDPHVAGPTYAELAETPNRLLEQVVTRNAYGEAYDACADILENPLDLQQSIANPARSIISVRDLTRAVVGKLCERWFGMPYDKAQPHAYAPLIDSLERFLLTSRYTFQYDPGKRLERDALQQGGTILSSYPNPPTGTFAGALRGEGYAAKFSDREGILRQAVVGAVVGFAPPTVGAVARVLDQWIESDEFWRVRADTIDSRVDATESRKALTMAVLAALGKTPSPPILYRTAVKSVRLGSVDLDAGATVVIALNSVYLDARKRGSPLPEAWLFGGRHAGAALTKGKTPHGCPVREAGTDVIAGIAAALFERKNVRRERRLVLSYDPT